MIKPPIVLASNSPRRRQLLAQLDLEFTIHPSTVDEDFSLPLPPVEFACHYANAKAEEVAQSFPDQLVIGADTIVVLDGNILGKPRDRADSFRMLSTLAGRTHTVYTGVALVQVATGINKVFSEATQVTFADLAADDINYYIDHYQPFDKAGSYGIQDWFAGQVTRIEGCFYNVVGFPLATFYRHYRRLIHID